MYTYMTYGSSFFLDKIKKKYSKRQILSFYNEDNAYLYEETDDKSVFSAPQSFTNVINDGKLLEKPTLLLYFIVKEARQEVFDTKPLPLEKLNDYEGYQAFRLLRPKRGETYVATFQFDRKSQIDDFRKSSFFRENFSKEALSMYQSEDIMANIYYSKYLYVEKPEELTEAED
ncbi:hypothetical protein MHJ97_10040 [Macrococcus epidermidis]|uniref:hypothetical protein n=1 Tax=Macrococcus epidermidis TaxID=1902580 RepID=UPI001EF1E3B3|nr:hypothetical protein [Macrococcus epidermidis]MCG7420776.1 hypothetical protein [Macrococcus epidermidis]